MSTNPIRQAVIWLNDPLNWTNPGGILDRLGEHLLISGAAVGLAGLVAWPLGIWLGHRGRGGNAVVVLSNVTLAMPVLATLTLLPLTPVGFGRPAIIIALAVFAVPPLLATAHTGVREIDPEIREAAVGMGLSPRQLLSRVEIPLAVPYLAAGLRTAAVQVVATAALAALVNGGGLGQFIAAGFGLGMVTGGGQVLAALVGLNKAVDIERQTPQVAAEEFAAAVGLAADLAADLDVGDGGEVVVGAANFSESQTLGELYRIALEAAGFEVRVQTIGNRELYLPELRDGAIQVVPEYAGTVTEFLNAQVNGAAPEPLASSDLVSTMVALRELGDEVGLTFGEPAAAANSNAFAVTSEFADAYGIRSLSDLAEKCSGEQTILGGPPECPQRPFCLAGLEEVYGLQVGEFGSFDAGGPLTKQALRSGEISVGLVFSSDGDLA